MLEPTNRFLCCFAAVMMVAIAGCSTVPTRHPVPEALEDSAEILGIPDLRHWGDDVPPNLEERLSQLEDDKQVRALYPALFGQPHRYLAISGGGAEGAYGAGLLVGWTKAGDRPEFQMVSGVSTGALIAPWAFLGPQYDWVLREVYTTRTTADILRIKRWIEIPFSDSAADSAPLLQLIQHYVDDEVVDAIAAEHRKGRGLYMGTTDLDHMRPRVWNIGAIAASAKPGAKELIHKVMLASASIPGIFPPVRIEVEAAGRQFDELHVDGGATTQVFVYPAAVEWDRILARLKVPGPARMFVIRNAAPSHNREVVEAKIASVAGRSISSLIRTQGLGDLYLIYMLTIRDGIDYNLAHIPPSFDAKPSEMFDKQYMEALFDLGYRTALRGYPWEKKPPGWEVKGTAGSR